MTSESGVQVTHNGADGDAITYAADGQDFQIRVKAF